MGVGRLMAKTILNCHFDYWNPSLMKNTNTYSRLEHQHFGVGGGEERAGLAKVEDSEIGPRHVMPLSSRHISFMERVEIFHP